MKHLAAIFVIGGGFAFAYSDFTEGLLAITVGLLCFIADYLDQIIKILKEGR